MTFLGILINNPQIACAVGVSSIVGVRLVTQTIGLGLYKEKLLQAYRDGVPTPVSKHTKEVAQEVLDKIQLTPHMEADMEIFTCLSQDPVYRGSTQLRTGSILGLPANFAFKSVEDIDRSKIQIGQKVIDWDSPEGKLFAQSLVLSDDAKRFAVGRQIFYLKNLNVFIDNTLLLFFSTLAYWAGHASNVLLNLKRRLPMGFRGLLYSGIASIGMTFYILLKDEYFCWQDKKVDRKAADLGDNYLTGGIEFYKKELQRNKALRVLLGDYGPKVYTPYGNYASMWRLAHTPPTSRKEILEKILKEKEKDVEAIESTA